LSRLNAIEVRLVLAAVDLTRASYQESREGHRDVSRELLDRSEVLRRRAARVRDRALDVFGR
jgi:hypothetical protein